MTLPAALALLCLSFDLLLLTVLTLVWARDAWRAKKLTDAQVDAVIRVGMREIARQDEVRARAREKAVVLEFKHPTGRAVRFTNDGDSAA